MPANISESPRSACVANFVFPTHEQIEGIYGKSLKWYRTRLWEKAWDEIRTAPFSDITHVYLTKVQVKRRQHGKYKPRKVIVLWIVIQQKGTMEELSPGCSKKEGGPLRNLYYLGCRETGTFDGQIRNEYLKNDELTEVRFEIYKQPKLNYMNF